MAMTEMNYASSGGGVSSMSLLKQFSTSVNNSIEDTTIDLSKCYLMVSYYDAAYQATYTDQAYIIRGDLTVVYGSNSDFQYTMADSTTFRCKHLTGQRTSNVRIYEIS